MSSTAITAVYDELDTALAGHVQKLKEGERVRVAVKDLAGKLRAIVAQALLAGQLSAEATATVAPLAATATAAAIKEESPKKRRFIWIRFLNAAKAAIRAEFPGDSPKNSQVWSKALKPIWEAIKAAKNDIYHKVQAVDDAEYLIYEDQMELMKAGKTAEWKKNERSKSNPSPLAQFSAASFIEEFRKQVPIAAKQIEEDAKEKATEKAAKRAAQGDAEAQPPKKKKKKTAREPVPEQADATDSSADSSDDDGFF